MISPKIIKPTYQPGEPVELLEAKGTWYINSVTIYKTYHVYQVWDGHTTFVNVDDWQIKNSLAGKQLAGFAINLTPTISSMGCKKGGRKE